MGSSQHTKSDGHVADFPALQPSADGDEQADESPEKDSGGAGEENSVALTVRSNEADQLADTRPDGTGFVPL